MQPPLPARISSLRRTVALVFAAVLGSFLASAFVTQQTSEDIAVFSETLAQDTTPSIKHLAAARGAVLESELILLEYMRASEPGRAEIEPRLEASLNRLARNVEAYLVLPIAPGEYETHDEVLRAWARFDEAVTQVQHLVDQGSARGPMLFESRVVPAGSAADRAVLRAVEFNADYGQNLAAGIHESRTRTLWIANALNALCVLLGIAGAILILREETARRRLRDDYSETLERRAEELEQFAGRVAHDIRNPLASARFSAELIVRRPEEAQAGAQRILRSVAAADAILAGLLEFARAGARPDPGARTDVRAVIAEFSGGIAQDAESAGIELRFHAVPPVLAACSTGVYLSLLGNLLRNAIKYMGDRPVRRIDVRVREEGALLRTEVEDTGPGIPEELQAALFQPYFRATRGTQPGLGLGLATVKRLAEGHRGRVGVHSVPGAGSIFWFDLPLAGVASPEAGRKTEIHGIEPPHETRH